MKFNRTLALAAFTLAVSAQAATTAPGGNLGTLTLFPALYSNAFSAPASGSLANANSYTFSLSATSKVTGSIYGVDMQAALNIGSLSITGNSGAVPSVLTGNVFTEIWGFSTGYLAAGTYTLSFAAPSGKALAGYMGSAYATAAPVPVYTAGERMPRPVLRKYASVIATTRKASMPSRSPIKYVASKAIPFTL